MAAQEAVKPVNPHHLTAKQLTADKANLAKARAIERVRPRTAKQKNASRHNLVKARAAQKARRSGKKYVTKKQAQAPLDSRETARDPQLNLGLPGQGQTENDCNLDLPADGNIHQLPVCAPVALAEHLAFWAGIMVSVDEILALHGKSSGQCTLADLLELAVVEGFAGRRLESFQRCDPDEAVPGWIYGINHPAGYHAVLAHPAGMISWGRLLHRSGVPREAWHLEWADA